VKKTGTEHVIQRQPQCTALVRARSSGGNIAPPCCCTAANLTGCNEAAPHITNHLCMPGCAPVWSKHSGAAAHTHTPKTAWELILLKTLLSGTPQPTQLLLLLSLLLCLQHLHRPVANTQTSSNTASPTLNTTCCIPGTQMHSYCRPWGSIPCCICSTKCSAAQLNSTPHQAAARIATVAPAAAIAGHCQAAANAWQPLPTLSRFAAVFTGVHAQRCCGRCCCCFNCCCCSMTWHPVQSPVPRTAPVLSC
jgi:hypothetical protein